MRLPTSTAGITLGRRPWQGPTAFTRRTRGSLAPVFRVSSDDSSAYTDAAGTILATVHNDRVRAIRDTVGSVLLTTNASHSGGYLELSAYAGGKRAIRFERSIAGIACGLVNASLDLGLTHNDYTVAARIVPLDAQLAAVCAPEDQGNTHLHWSQTLTRPYWEAYIHDAGGLAGIVDWTPHVNTDELTDSRAETVVWRVGVTTTKLDTAGVSRSVAHTPPTDGAHNGVVIGGGYSGDGRYPSRFDLLELRIYNRELTDDEVTQVTAELDAITAPVHRYVIDRPLVIWDGASLATEFGTNVLLTGPELLRRALDGGSHVLNACIGAATIGNGSYVNLTSTAVARIGGLVEEAYDEVIVVAQSLVNDMIQDSASAATCLARAKAYAQEIKTINATAKVIFTTDLPNQPIVDATLETVRTDFNAALLALTSGSAVTTAHYLVTDPGTDFIDAVIDLCEDADMGDPGDQSNTTYYHTDGAHLTAVGHARIEGTYIRPAVIYHGAVLDPNLPTVVSATIEANGTTLTVVMSEPVTGNSGLTITPSGGAATLAYVSGSGTETLTYTISRTILTAETATLAGTSSDIDDLAGNGLADFSGFTVTNTSGVANGLLIDVVAVYEQDDETDSHSGGLDLTETGTVTHGAGLIGNCATFTGAGNYQTGPSAAPYRPGNTEPWYIAGWIRMETVGNYNIWGIETGYNMYFNGTAARCQIFSGSGNVNCTFNDTFSADVWYFFETWYDGTDVFVDVNRSGSPASVTTTFDGQFSNVFHIAKNDFFDNPDFSVDGVFIRIGSVPSSGDRDTLYNSGAGLAYPFS